jgi:hypothetical protein
MPLLWRLFHDWLSRSCCEVETRCSIPANIRIKLKDIEELRESKLQTSLRDLDQDHAAINISNISAMELNK